MIAATGGERRIEWLGVVRQARESKAGADPAGRPLSLESRY